MKKKPESSTGKNVAVRIWTEQWRLEMENARIYELLAKREPHSRRREIFQRLAEIERSHATRCREQLEKLGAKVPILWETGLRFWYGWRWSWTSPEQALLEMEARERKLAEDSAVGEDTRALLPHPSRQVWEQILKEERTHAGVVHALATQSETQRRLQGILRREPWHKRGGSWIADAVYGANDGLGAVFGIVSGMAGATGNQEHYVILSGLAGMLASSLSMGAGAYLAAKSQRELMEAEIAREKEELHTNPQEEKEELSLFYELQGLAPHQAQELAEKMSQQPEAFLEMMLQNELGLTMSQLPNPWVSCFSALLSTASGAFVPLVPFFFLPGVLAVATSFAVSIVAHFAIGAAKSLLTLRSWWASGLEMTLVGILEAVVTYFLGKWFGNLD
ncbi:VIT1/CCC1 transporter family protein [Candidatus Methylacidithermus pantelleriae]|uniref:Ferritin n=1 Tax=Candidatus Methylacidithermus pantelleriae TaxID=2744239 RepID=A0A8J2BV18_9BACT|nr:VIT1/CCC1 transporter family protein [Candidatus Methylacidithermus pantelleriae]CAF0701032.1 Ferritin [Candidatus Methylacidithermus pantelleriae]